MKKKVHKNDKFFIRTLYLIIITCMVTFFSMAKYQSIYTSSGVATIANWAIKVNDVDITTNGTTLTNVIELKPDQSANVVSGKLAPGYGGYFDVTIDPDGTEVAFDYSIKIDASNLPTDIEIIGYHIGTEEGKENLTPITGNIITGTMALKNNTAFASSDSQNFRFFWEWNDVRDNDELHTTAATSGEAYNVQLEVIMTQVVDAES